MTKLLTAASLMLIAIGAMALPAMAEPWFDKYDSKHDGKWRYNDFAKAHRDYARRHHEEKVISERQLRHHWSTLDKDHHGYVKHEQVKQFHHWD